MNAQGALLIRPTAVSVANSERIIFTATLNTEFTRFILVNIHSSTESTVELRHIPKGESSHAMRRIYRGSLAANVVSHVLESNAEGQGVTLEPGDTIGLTCDRTDTYVQAYGITQTTKQVHHS